MDKFGKQSEKITQRLDKWESTNLDHESKFVHLAEKTSIENKALESRITTLENQLQSIWDEEAPKITQLKELIESRTNRQIRKPLNFRYKAETKPEEYFSEVKVLLVRIISDKATILPETALNSIDHAHHEAPNEEGERLGKRLIYAAFHSWERSQQVIDDNRQRCIDRNFKISADQMCSPMTSRRRNLAFLKGKELKDQWIITSG